MRQAGFATGHRPVINLYDYQRAAVDAITAAHQNGIKRPALAMATGGGKTIVLAKYIEESNEQTLVIAHRQELITQSQQKIGYMIDPQDIGIVMGAWNQYSHPIVVASIQTIANPKRLAKLVGRFGLVVIDEAHHAAAPTYVETLKQLGVGAGLETKALGVSATWDREDGLGFEHVFDDIVFEVGTAELIGGGYLSDIRALCIETHLDLAGVPGNGAGDFNAEAVGRKIVDSDYADTLANAVREHASDRVSLVFAPNIRTSELFADALNAVGIRAAAVSGETPKEERAQAITDLQNGKLQALVNCAVFTEGTDIPIVDCIVMGRPTKSRALYSQMAGRGLRKYPGKSNCLILDLVGVATRHDLQTAASLIGQEVKNGAKEVKSFREWLDDPDMYAEARLPGTGEVEVKGNLGEHFIQTAKSIDLIDRTRMSWTSVDRSTYSLAAGEQGQIVIRPDQRGMFDVVQYDGRSGIRNELATGLDIGYAQGIAEQFVIDAGAKALVNPNAGWRKRREPATEKQLTALTKWRIPHDPETITKVEASNLLDAAITRANLRRKKWNEGGADARAS